MARGCTKVATSSIDASVAVVGVLIAGRVAGFWILPCRPWVDGDEMLVELMEILGNRWKQGMEFRVSEEKKKGMRLLFSSPNVVMPRRVGL